MKGKISVYSAVILKFKLIWVLNHMFEMLDPILDLKGHSQAKIIKKNRWFYFGFLIRPYDVNMSID